MRERVGEIAKRTKENVKRVGAIAGIVGTGALALAGCGESEGIPSKQEAKAYAMKDYKLTWDSAQSPVDRFVLQYIVEAKVDILQEDSVDGKRDNNAYHGFTFGNACLQNSSYDIAGGRIKGRFSGGLFGGGGYVNGRVPSAAATAYVDSRDPDVLTIQSGHANSRDLHFSGAQGDKGYLDPMDQQTKSVLETTYGCIPAGEVEYDNFIFWTGDTSDFIIRTEGDMARPAMRDPSN